MTWTVKEHPAMVGGLPVLTVFEIYESDERAMVASLQSSEHCPGYGWTAAELRARARVMAAAPALRDALRGALEHMEWSTPQGSEAYLACMEALALLDASEVAA